MHLNNLRHFKYLGQLIIECHEGDREVGTTITGTELELWLELPSPLRCIQYGHRPKLWHKNYCYLQIKYCVITRWWNSYKKIKSFCDIHCIWPRIKTFSDFKSKLACAYLNTENDCLTQKPVMELTGFRSDPFSMSCAQN